MEHICYSQDNYKMRFKKQEWFEMKRNGIKFELTVRDQDFKRLETKQFTPHDFAKTMKDVGNRYGIEEKMLKPSREFEDEMGFLKEAKLI